MRPRFPLPPTGFSSFTQHLKGKDETVSTGKRLRVHIQFGELLMGQVFGM